MILLEKRHLVNVAARRLHLLRMAGTLLLSGMLTLVVQPAFAQSSCSFSTVSDPPRQMLVCGEGLRIELEPSVQSKVLTRAGNAPPRALELDKGAAFIEVAPGSRPTQIRTPHAIAAVRGTTYVVDVSDTGTSVFVVEGEVEVRKADDQSGIVVLGQGEGVDVAADTGLEVRRWPAPRVSGLLARFGR